MISGPPSHFWFVSVGRTHAGWEKDTALTVISTQGKGDPRQEPEKGGVPIVEQGVHVAAFEGPKPESEA